MPISSRVRGLSGLVLAVAAVTLAALAPSRADAVSLVADYRFDGNFDSSVGTAPPIDALPPIGSFASAAIDGKPDGIYTFASNTGLRVKRAVFPSQFAYSTIVTFRLDTTTGYRRLLAFDTFDAGSDNGVYNLTGRVGFYDDLLPNPITDFGPSAVLADGAVANLAFTRTVDDATAGYVDGALQFTHADPTDQSIVSADGVRYFRDDGAAENSAGAVARVRIYDDALTADQVLQIQQVGGLPASASQVTRQRLIKGNPRKGKRKVKAVETGLVVVCPGEAVPCPATATVTLTKGGRQTQIGTSSSHVEAGVGRSFEVPISARGRRLIAKKGKLTVTSTVSITAPRGDTAQATSTGKL